MLDQSWNIRAQNTLPNFNRQGIFQAKKHKGIISTVLQQKQHKLFQMQLSV